MGTRGRQRESLVWGPSGLGGAAPSGLSLQPLGGESGRQSHQELANGESARVCTQEPANSSASDIPPAPLPSPPLEHKKLQVRAWSLLPRTTAPPTRVAASPLSL